MQVHLIRHTTPNMKELASKKEPIVIDFLEFAQNQQHVSRDHEQVISETDTTNKTSEHEENKNGN